MIGMGKSFTQVGCSEFASSGPRTCVVTCAGPSVIAVVARGRETVVQTGSPPTSHVSAIDSCNTHARG